MVSASIFQKLDVALFSLSFADIGQNLEHLPDAFTARSALAARFIRQEIEKVFGDIDHAGVFIHHDHAAGTHDGADFGQFVKVDSYIQELFRNTSSRRTAGLHCLELFASRDAAADLDR